MRKTGFIFTICLFVLFGCNKDEASDLDNEVSTPSTPNILFIIADDMGKDATAGFSEGSTKPNTPNLNAIKNNGLVFNNLWVNPTCSPTRSSIITGKYGYRTGVKFANDVLNPSEKILQKYINEQTNNLYSTGIVGKWHLSGAFTSINPESFGVDYYAGLISGIARPSYYQWQLTKGGSTNVENEYVTKVFTDLSIDWINSQSKPWFLWLAYNAPHTPFHLPPSEMHSQGNLPPYADGLNPMPYYMASIEAMDYQIGKLLEGIPDAELDNTIIIFIGDNGSPGQVAQLPYGPTKAKGSLYQGGINVPMFISGNGVGRIGEDDNLICSTDLFCTIAELAGIAVPEINDSKSFKTLLNNNAEHREFQYSEIDNGTDDLWTVSNGAFKLIVNANGNEEMYNLFNDPYESNDLLNGTLTTEEVNTKVELETKLTNIRN
jgi:arylsulfatase A-like enzyme